MAASESGMEPNTISHTGRRVSRSFPSIPTYSSRPLDVFLHQRIGFHLLVNELDAFLQFAASSTTDAWAIPRDASSTVDFTKQRETQLARAHEARTPRRNTGELRSGECGENASSCLESDLSRDSSSPRRIAARVRAGA